VVSIGIPTYNRSYLLVCALPSALAQTYKIGFAIDTDHVRGLGVTASRVEKVFRSCGYQTGTIRNENFLTTWAKKG